MDSYVQTPGHWAIGWDVVFKDLTTEDFDHTAASVVIGDDTWDQANGAAYLDDLDLVKATGLLPDLSNANSTFDITGDTCWRLTAEIQSLVPTFEAGTEVWFEGIFDDLGDAATEEVGLYAGNVNTDGTARGHSLCLSHSGAATQVTRYRQQGATVATRVSALTGKTAIAIGMKYGMATFWTGTATVAANGTPQFPTSWTEMPDSAINATVPAASAFGVDDIVGFWAATGNVSDNFMPAIQRARIHTKKTLTPYG